jgi:hypothetical protein
MSDRLLTAARFSEQAGRSLLLMSNSCVSPSVPQFGLAAVPHSSSGSTSARASGSSLSPGAPPALSRGRGGGIGDRGRGGHSSGRGTIGPCHTCVELGHFRRDCQQHYCERCHELGHFASRCLAPAPKLDVSRPPLSRVPPGLSPFSAPPAPSGGVLPPAGGPPLPARGSPLRGLVAVSDSDSKFTFDEWVALINKDLSPYIFSPEQTDPTVSPPLSPAATSLSWTLQESAPNLEPPECR